MSDAHIMNIAWRTGGQAFLASCGEDGTEMLRGAITSFAQNGGAAYIDQTIVALGFGNDDAALTDEQLGQLGEALVDGWRE